jgi:hypothetical protein
VLLFSLSLPGLASPVEVGRCCFVPSAYVRGAVHPARALCKLASTVLKSHTPVDAAGKWEGQKLAALIFATAEHVTTLQQLASSGSKSRAIINVNPQWDISEKASPTAHASRAFVKQFTTVFCFRRVAVFTEHVTLLRVFPGGWQVHWAPPGQRAVLLSVEAEDPPLTRLEAICLELGQGLACPALASDGMMAPPRGHVLPASTTWPGAPSFGSEGSSGPPPSQSGGMGEGVSAQGPAEPAAQRGHGHIATTESPVARPHSGGLNITPMSLFSGMLHPSTVGAVQAGGSEHGPSLGRPGGAQHGGADGESLVEALAMLTGDVLDATPRDPPCEFGGNMLADSSALQGLQAGYRPAGLGRWDGSERLGQLQAQLGSINAQLARLEEQRMAVTAEIRQLVHTSGHHEETGLTGAGVRQSSSGAAVRGTQIGVSEGGHGAGGGGGGPQAESRDDEVLDLFKVMMESEIP